MKARSMVVNPSKSGPSLLTKWVSFCNSPPDLFFLTQQNLRASPSLSSREATFSSRIS